MDVLEALYGGYGEGVPNGRGPDQSRVVTSGNKFLESQFPKLDSIKTARIVGGDRAVETSKSDAL